ncbi:hypothetical protein A4X13_0g9295, partial [Tilletia indica]
ILTRMETVASKGLRVLALAQRSDEESSTSTPFLDEDVPTKSLQLATSAEVCRRAGMSYDRMLW